MDGDFDRLITEVLRGDYPAVADAQQVFAQVVEELRETEEAHASTDDAEHGSRLIHPWMVELQIRAEEQRVEPRTHAMRRVFIDRLNTACSAREGDLEWLRRLNKQGEWLLARFD